MNTYHYELYTITTKTNLHVGAGDNNFGIVDNLVQRDTITKLPAINASSLKGALREYFKDIDKETFSCVYPESTDENKKNSFINFFFGTDTKESESEAGALKILSALLLAIPMRSEDKPYHLVTAPFIIETLKTFAKDVGIDKIEELDDIVLTKQHEIILEDETINLYKKIEEGILKDTIVIENTTFMELIERLPFVARNHLENGISQNLFYEEVVPRESKFFFFLGFPDKSIVDFKKYYNDKYPSCFKKFLQNELIQIGANASLGYGLCKIAFVQKGESDEQTDK